MDTKAPHVEAVIAQIKADMPETYKTIQDKASEIGRIAFELVRRGLRGEPNCFYAFEAGRVVGTPFVWPQVQADVAKLMVQFGVKSVCIFAIPGKGIEGVTYGAN